MRSLFVLLVITLFAAGGCKKNDHPPVDDQGHTITDKGKTIVTGIVLDEENKPIGGAEVSVGGQIILTDGSGVFMLPEQPVSGDETYIVARKEGYFNAARRVRTLNGGVTQFKLVLVEKGNIKYFSSAAGVNTVLDHDVRINIPAGGIITKEGTAYNGVVELASRYIDPEARNISDVMPGGDFSAIRTDQREVILYTYGAVEVQLQDQTGRALNLANGKQATLEFPIAQSQAGNAPATIPLWHFDETKGKWIEEGTAERQGGKYVGQVAHFSSWNVDKPQPKAMVQGKVKLCDGTPARGISVHIGSVTVTTDEKGAYQATVPAEIPMKGYVENFYDMGTGITPHDIPALGENERKTVDFQMDCIAALEGSVTGCDGKPQVGAIVIKWNTGSTMVMTGADGKFNCSVPKNREISVSAYGFNSKKGVPVTLTTPSSDKKSIDPILICEDERSGEVVFTLDGAGYNNQTVTINTSASEVIPEAVYEVDGNQTRLFKTGKNKFGFVTVFEGNQAGAPEDFNVSIVYADNNNGNPLNIVISGVEEKVVFTITKYGAVGEKIEGTFSGTFEKRVNADPNATEMQVKNGRFSLYRSVNE